MNSNSNLENNSIMMSYSITDDIICDMQKKLTYHNNKPF